MEILKRPASEKHKFIADYKSDMYYLKHGGYEDSGTMLASSVTYICDNETNERVVKMLWEPKKPDNHIHVGRNIKRK